MGKQPGATKNRNDNLMHALHGAARSTGKCGQEMTIRQWEQLVLAWFGTRSRQSVHDITWAMDRLGMIDWDKGHSVAFRDEAPITGAVEEAPQHLPEAAPA